MLRDLTIQNYRCFEDFHIDGLEQVNLFVGNNNSGKTSLLEAVYLLESKNKLYSLFDLLKNRSVFEIYSEKSDLIRNIFSEESIRHIFYNHSASDNLDIKINSQLTLPIEIPQILQPSVYRNEAFFKLSSKIYGDYELIEFTFKYFDIYSKQEKAKAIKINNRNDKITTNYETSLKEIGINAYLNNIVLREDKCQLILQTKKDINSLKSIWKKIYLTRKEEKVVEALKIIDVEIQGIGFYLDENYNVIRLKINGSEEPVPIKSMGEGMYRMLTIAMSLVTAENGVLLVDEIETGLHYEAQTDMWRLILETAKELNVQVFATTHSWDCIAAYQEALSQVEDSSIGKLFRLDSKYGELRAVEYDAKDLEVVTREGIEVR